MSENKTDASEENFREGTTPVQAFTTPVVSPTESRVRLGRPQRVVAAKPPEPAGAASAVPGGITPTTKPAVG